MLASPLKTGPRPLKFGSTLSFFSCSSSARPTSRMSFEFVCCRNSGRRLLTARFTLSLLVTIRTLATGWRNFTFFDCLADDDAAETCCTTPMLSSSLLLIHPVLELGQEDM